MYELYEALEVVNYVSGKPVRILGVVQARCYADGGSLYSVQYTTGKWKGHTFRATSKELSR